MQELCAWLVQDLLLRSSCIDVKLAARSFCEPHHQAEVGGVMWHTHDQRRRTRYCTAIHDCIDLVQSESAEKFIIRMYRAVIKIQPLISLRNLRNLIMNLMSDHDLGS